METRDTRVWWSQRDDWFLAINIMLTQQEAKALEVILQAMQPDKLFCTSKNKPASRGKIS